MVERHAYVLTVATPQLLLYLSATHGSKPSLTTSEVYELDTGINFYVHGRKSWLIPCLRSI